MGVPTVVVRQHGARWDAGHRAAYDGAVALLAPFGPELEEPDVPERVRRRTWYAGGLGRTLPGTSDPDDRSRRSRTTRATARHRLGWDAATTGVALLLGRGGGQPHADDVEAAARATPDHRWLVVGDLPGAAPLLSTTGWVDDPLPWLDAADVVVGSAGHNTIMEASLVARSFVCIPQRRPFDEQFRKAARLRDLDVAEVLDGWPEPAAWPGIVQRARRRPTTRLAAVADPAAATRTARWLEDLADRYTP
nr:glycosyltransferase [Salsipaludibacter albus]